MICYKDKTFCRESTCANFKTCHRALTEEVKENAKKWWGGDDYPICTYAEGDKPSCYET